jgi:hypothetical protein
MNSSKDYFQEIEDQLSFITTNFVQSEDEVVRKLLFSNEGEWQDFATLCEPVESLRQPLLKLSQTEPSTKYIDVTWLSYLPSGHGKGYCLIIFFCESLYWYQVAIYNRARFLSSPLLGQ